MSRPEIKEQLSCYHCGDSCVHDKIRIEEKTFCCEGCKMVYEILNENQLCQYYDLNAKPGISQKMQVRADKFVFLDDEAVQRKLLQFTDGKQSQLSFYLPQMHCSSCLYLLENLHRLHPGILSSRVNFSRKEVFLVYENDKTSLRKVVETLTAIGYEPHLSLQEFKAGAERKTDRSRIIKIGVAGFCFSNIMMMSFPEYFSIGGFLEEEIGLTLKYFIVLLSLPVLFYCSTEFFSTAWKGLRNKFLNIDAPIALAILITFGRSMYEIISGSGSGYLDSMSGIVFFMLVGRVLQDRTYQSISFDRDFKSFFPIAVNVIKDNQVVPTTVDALKVNDIIQIHSQELVPVDAILSKGNAEIDYSFVSGESIPVLKEKGEIVYAGGKQLGGLIELMVVKEVSQSYLTNLWNKEVFSAERKRPQSYIHTISKYFTYAVLLIALLAAAWWLYQGRQDLMWNALTTIMIVACPCALLLSSTFTNGNILRILSKNKFYLRHPDVIEDLAAVDQLVFDKTGTLTQNRKLNIRYHGRVLNPEEKKRFASLMAQSNHPLSRAVLEYLNQADYDTVENFKVREGEGIEGWVDEHHIKIGSAAFLSAPPRAGVQASSVMIMQDGELLGEFSIYNKYRFGLRALITKLKSRYRISVLSGDNDAESKNLQELAGQETELLFHQSPEDKLEYIRHLQEVQGHRVMMVGDGLNDAGALRQSQVGVGITDGNNNFTPACDAILDATQFSNLDRYLAFARFGKYIIMASFILSIAYNFIGIYFAVQGSLSPLIAAILMPCSSISIILLTWGMSELLARWNRMI